MELKRRSRAQTTREQDVNETAFEKTRLPARHVEMENSRGNAYRMENPEYEGKNERKAVLESDKEK